MTACVRTIDDCFSPNSSITIEQLIEHTDKLIAEVVAALEGEQEEEIVRELKQLRAILEAEGEHESLSPRAEAARAELINLVNNFYYERLTAVPTIKEYMQALGHA